MSVETPKEKWPGAVREVTLGASHGPARERRP